MRKSTILKTEITGAVIAALCCFTPILVMLLGAIGLSAWVGHLDAVLMPALFFFVGLTVYTYTRPRKSECCTDKHGEKE